MPAPQQHRLIFKNIGADGYTNDLACYQRSGGYEVLKKSVLRKPEEIMDEVKKSGLRGRGGAGFSCGVKWSLVDRKSGKPIYLVVNADESEPGTFKDRYIIYQDPHQLIEGIMISCFANKVERAYIYIRGEFPDGAKILEKAIADARFTSTVEPGPTSAARRQASLSRWRASGPTRASSPRIFPRSSASTCARRSSTTWRPCAM
jgi:NADH-quinone oxidoreductase subunit F